MNEDLASMVEHADQPSSGIPTETDLPEQEVSNVKIDEPTLHQTPPSQTTQPPSEYEFTTMTFPDWFAQNHQNFGNVGHVRLSIDRIRPERNFIFKIPDPKGRKLEDGRDEMVLCLFMDAHKIPVLDIPGTAINVYHNSTFLITYDIGSGLFMKCYGVKTGLIVVYCASINGKLIPYAKTKLKKKDPGLNRVEPNLGQIQSKLTTTVDKEALQIQYKQIKKYLDEITTVESTIDWMITRVQSVLDVNHLLQIDDLIIGMIS